MRNLLLTFGVTAARVERTLLSVAFDVDLDVDFDFLSQETPRVPHPCAFFAQGWDTQTPAALAFDVDVALDIARVEQTLLSAAFDFAVDLIRRTRKRMYNRVRAALQRRVKSQIDSGFSPRWKRAKRTTKPQPQSGNRMQPTAQAVGKQKIKRN